MRLESINGLNVAMANGGEVRGTLFVQVTQKLQRTTKNGKPYLEVLLADTDGSLSLKVWETAPWYTDFCRRCENTTVIAGGRRTDAYRE